MTRPITNIQGGVRRLRRHAAFAEFVAHFLFHLTIAVALSGAAAIFLRSFYQYSRFDASLAFVLVAFTPATAWFAARRNFISEATAAAWLDLRAGATGLLLTEIESGDGKWASRAEALLVNAAALPPIRIRKQMWKLAPAVIFAIAAVAVPISRADRVPALTAHSLEQIADKLAALEENVKLEEKTAEELHERLDRVREQLDAMRPEAAYEAIDRLQEKLQEESEKATEDASRAMQTFAKAGEATKSDPMAAQEQLEQALADVKNAGLTQGIADQLLKKGFPGNMSIPEGTKLEPAETLKLSEAAREALAEKLEKMAEAGLLTKKSGEKIAGNNSKKAKVDWDKFKEHKCDESCKEGGT